MDVQVRIDKWLWAVRIFKTRTIAAEACKKGKIYIAGSQIKPSRTVKIGDIISVKKPPITYQFRVEGLIEKRIGAKLVDEYMTNITPESELDAIILQKQIGFMQRDRGTGRPTKKERRDMDSFFDDWDIELDE
ncbi:MAG: RNA-binding S4 domain-containing protein [Mangrovibacterium sp.]